MVLLQQANMTNEAGDLAIGITLTFGNVSLVLAVFHALRANRRETSQEASYQDRRAHEGEFDVDVNESEVYADSSGKDIEMATVHVVNPLAGKIALMQPRQDAGNGNQTNTPTRGPAN